VTLPAQTKKRAADLGISIGVMTPGKLNAITDVSGVKVGHTTLVKADSIRTGSHCNSSSQWKFISTKSTGSHLCWQRIWKTGRHYPGKRTWEY
jgi:hypothetical protein